MAAGFGLITGAMTARYLGASAKGTLSLLTFLVALGTPVFAFGLGEASQVLVGQRRFAVQRGASAATGILLMTTATGAGLFVVVAGTLVPPSAQVSRLEIIAAAGILPLAVLVAALGRFVDSLGNGMYVGTVRASVAGATAFATYLVMSQLSRSITGALVAMSAGLAFGLLLVITRLVRLGVPPRPRWDPAYLRPALRIGIPIQIALIIIIASTRLDLLFVYRLAGSSEAGTYSVALTVGQLAGYAPVSLANASFSKLAGATEEQARHLAARVCRAAVAVGLLVAVGLSAVTPWVIPLAFGRDFAEAVGPALVLLAAGVVWGAQLAACRCVAARGTPSVQLASFSASLITMVVLDVALIPRWEGEGAAVASLASSAVGLILATSLGRSRLVIPALSGFLPRWSDLTYAIQVWRRIRNGGRPADPIAQARRRAPP